MNTAANSNPAAALKDGQPIPAEAKDPQLQEGKEDEKPEIEAAAVNPEEVKARQTGWVSKEEWIEQGKDPDDWVNAKRYNQTGQMVDTIKGLQKQVTGFDQRIADNNALWTARLQQEKAALMADRDEAIDMADKAKVKQLDQQILSIDQQTAYLANQQPKKQQPQINQPTPEDTAIENAYYNGLNRAQKAFARDVTKDFVLQGLSGQSLVDAVKSEMDKEFPTVNNRRNTTSKTDSPRPGQRAKSNDDISLDTLTPTDKRVMADMRRASPRYANKTDAEMLKILKDSKL